MLLHWTLDGSAYRWDIPIALETHYLTWLDNRDTPDQYLDLWPQGMCRLFEGWIRMMEQKERAVMGIEQIIKKAKEA